MRRIKMKPWIAVIAVTAAALWVGSGMAGSYDEPRWELISEHEEFDLRRYEPYLIAETDVEGGFRGAGNRAFRILAGYIFGKNEPGTKMAMTVPVISSAQATEGGEWTYQFVMEPGHTLDTLPAPSDGRVRLRELPERRVAVRSFGGTWSETKLRREVTSLLEALRREGLQPLAEPLLARYNGPFTPWFLRRNEILVEVASPEQGSAAARMPGSAVVVSSDGVTGDMMWTFSAKE